MVGILDKVKGVLSGVKQDMVKKDTTDNALAIVGECYEDKSAREPADRQAFINHAFLNGRQWLQWNDTSKKFETDNKVPNWRVRLVVNKILPIFMDRIAKVLKNAPVTYVEPATQSEEDHALAKIGTGLVDHLYRITNNEEKNQTLVGQFLIAGVSYKHVFWNPNKGKVLGMYQYTKNDFPIMNGEKPATDDKGNPLFKITDDKGTPMGEMRTGEVDTEILSLTEVIFPKGIPTYDECPWGMIVKVVDKDKIKEIYGKEVNEEDIPDDAVFNSKPVTVYGGTGGQSATSKPQNSVLLKELYMRPYFDKKENKFYKKGRVITVANGVVLKDRENIIYDSEYKITEIPIIPYWDLKLPHMREGDTMIRHLIPLQKEYNKTRSQNIEIKNLINKPKWLKPRAGNIMEEITSEPAQQIEYTYPYRPEVIAPAGIPQSNYNELEFTSKDIEDIASWHDISRGNAPAQVRSGVALNYLLERDESPLAIPVRSFELQEEKAAQLMLLIADQKYKEERKIEVTGNNGAKKDVMFKAGSIGPNRHVVIKAGSAMPKSLFAKQQFILQLKNEGLLGNPNDPVTQKKILGLLQFGDVDSVYDNSILDERLANYENEETKKGKQIQANPFDDHIIHINIHERLLKAIDADPKIKELMTAHWKMHKDAIPPQPMPVAKIGIDSKDMTKTQIATALEISGVPAGQDGQGDPTIGEEELEKKAKADAILQTQKLKIEQENHKEDVWAKHRGHDINAEKLALDAQVAATEASKPDATTAGKE